MSEGTPGVPPSPYKGLTHYTEEDTGFFFGRESERSVIIANLMASRLTLVYGASGVGKSSLMRAGVARHLRDLTKKDLDEFGEAQFLPVVFAAWKDDPLGELIGAAQAAAENLLGRRPELPEGRLDEQLAALAEELDTTLLIILDQTEEYFLYHPTDEGQGSFAGDFPRAVNRRDLRVNFAVSIREDGLAMLDRFKGRIPNLFENYLRIDHLKREAARDAIVKPIDEFNRLYPDQQPVEIEPELVEAVLDQIRTGAVVLGAAGEGAVNGGKRAQVPGADDDRIETPYLQLVMSRLWNEELSEGSRVLRLATLERLGGAQKIVRTHLDEAMSDLKPAEQDAAATIFRQLVTPSGTKIAHTVPDLADYARVPPDELSPVLERLSGGDVRILRPVAPPPGQLDGGRYEIFHDVLAPAILDWRARYVEAKTREEAEREAKEAREQAQRERRRARIFRAVALVAIACAVLAAILGLFTWRQKQTARSKALAGQALANLAVDPAKSIDEALQALRVKRTQDAADALRRAVSESRERQILNVKGGTVNGLAVSPDGRLIATAGEDAKAKLWERKTGRLVRTLAQTGAVNAVSFSADGRFLATANNDKRASIWDVGSGKRTALFQHRAAVDKITFSPDGRDTFTVSGGALQKWDARSGRRLWSHRAPGGDGVTAVGVSPSGEQLATGSEAGNVQIWDAQGAPLANNARNFGVNEITSVEFSHSGKQVVVSSGSGVSVWDYGSSGYSLLASAGGLPVDARFSPDDELVAAGNADDTIRVFDWRTQKPLFELRGHAGAVNGLAYTPDGRFLVSASDDRTVRVWDASVGQIIRTPDAVYAISFSDDGSLIAYGGYNFARVARTGATKPFATLSPGEDYVLGTAFRPGSDGRFVAVAFKDSVQLWDINRDRIAFRLRNRSGAVVNGLAFSADGKRLATADDDGFARVWNLETRQVEHNLAGHRGGVNSVALSADGKIAATGGADQTVRIWNVAREQQLHRVRASGEVKSVALNEKAGLVAAASAGLATGLWNYETGKLVRTLPTSSVNGV
ncbi:MAG: hypothetical protein M3R70_09090, partial [Actinomycetota bacterium]|nr:hypothetical protein [Actinomycetota bacterium]